MSLLKLNYIKGLSRAYPFFISIFLFLVGFIFQSDISIFLFTYILILDLVVVKGLKYIFQHIYKFLDMEYLPIIGTGLRPIDAKYCGCFIDEHNIEGIPTSFGLPSGHSIIAIAVSVFGSYYILENYPDTLKRKLSLTILNLLGIFMASSRIWLGCHTIQQVIIGSLIGYLCGYYGYILWKFIKINSMFN